MQPASPALRRRTLGSPRSGWQTPIRCKPFLETCWSKFAQGWRWIKDQPQMIQDDTGLFLNLWWQNSFANLVYTQIIKHLTKLWWVFKHYVLWWRHAAPLEIWTTIFSGLFVTWYAVCLHLFFPNTPHWHVYIELIMSSTKYQKGLEGFRHSSLWMLPEIEISSELSTMETIIPLAFITYNYIYIHGHPLPRLTSRFCENHLIIVFGQNLSCWSS